MSLNSQVLQTMKEQGIADDEALAAQTALANSLPPVVANTNIPVGTEASELSKELKQRLLNPSTKYSSLVEGVDKVSNMEEVQSNIATQKSISFVDAQEVAMTFEGFESKVNLKEFTQVPSQTNLAFSQRFMTQAIKMRREEVISEFEAFFGSGAEDAEDAFNDYSGMYTEALRDDILELQTKLVPWLSDKANVDKQMLHAGGEFVNIFTTPIFSLPKRIEFPGNGKMMVDVFVNLTQCLENNFHIVSLLNIIKDAGSFETLMKPNYSGELKAADISLQHFLNLFGSPYLTVFIEKAEELAGNAVTVLEKLREDDDVDPSDFESTRDFVIRNGAVIDSSNKTIHYYVELIELLRPLFVYVHGAFDYLQIDK